MLEQDDAKKVISTIIRDLSGVSVNSDSFQKLPDKFWGYYARGHDKKGKFGFIVTYSENDEDVDNLLKMYQEWVEKNKNHSE
ncbi:MAG: hypothetical protein GWN01_06480 [Nitrosopumilaceae archaeon]|nr:hypothetical protein [Nitrosopumilaceae archaeon]NIU00584.1 hypothetical protein [Nitrosopumilaceae archaeon]NIU86970.1 hypothetical protein [Nitrosopumilaceae archaeon]NIV66434.1 hypothetical protein [Nitrosopumilaceae archaeon]NIX61186.1 hypothetical protein [Nitrosopumilaceae archaeon]